MDRQPPHRQPPCATAFPGFVPAMVLMLLLAGGAPVAGHALAAPLEPATGAAAPLPTVAALVAGLEKRSGLLDLYLDRKRGKVWLRVPPPHGPGGEVASYLYVEGLVSGLGSNPVGLDRGQLGNTRVVTLRRLGGRLLVEVENLR